MNRAESTGSQDGQVRGGKVAKRAKGTGGKVAKREGCYESQGT